VVRAVTDMSWLPEPPGSGLLTRLHRVPFQCRISVLPRARPTAQALRAEVAATPSSTDDLPAGTGTCFQDRPFQCTISDLLALVTPAAQALSRPIANNGRHRACIVMR
jgi:hypothetical protein